MSRFRTVFTQPKPIIGMLHLSGGSASEVIDRAHEELEVYASEGLAGAIIENYCCRDSVTFMRVIDAIDAKAWGSRIKIGINVLPNEHYMSLPIAHERGMAFVQLDHVAGEYREGELNTVLYERMRRENPDPIVLGGVDPKYYHPRPSFNINRALEQASQRADAVVVTGAGTGIETPMTKILRFRDRLGYEFPLIVGAGLHQGVIAEQLAVADGAIVGSAFKPGKDEYALVQRELVRPFMDAVRRVERVYSNGR